MEALSIKNKGQARIFKHPFLEAISKTRPWVIYTLYIPMVICLVYYAHYAYQYAIGLMALVFLAGMFNWTLFEYLTHRFLFHFKARTPIAKRLVYIFHENHHEFPRDINRLFMPPVPSLILSATVFLSFYGISSLILGTPGYGIAFFAGFIFGYLLYVSLHFAIHAYPPPKYLKVLWRNHYLHHYKYPDHFYGVSSPLWDTLFGTKSLKKKNKTKPQPL
ncbi:sterol desaturase family protein [Pedobacter panaciterrae]|uniref:sterol desaturase family protein n=1 Tax=Pedobacter panaciterrae TaxID=363849 RepID=UPI00155DD141|nr:sterol desaturase family protein [Pedobacter panaciterrae]NQX54524.1 sterol desaturase family protein [Pedobacter panaciterrae]